MSLVTQMLLDDNHQLKLLIKHMVKLNALLTKYRNLVQELAGSVDVKCSKVFRLEDQYQRLVKEGDKIDVGELLKGSDKLKTMVLAPESRSFVDLQEEPVAGLNDESIGPKKTPPYIGSDEDLLISPCLEDQPKVVEDRSQPSELVDRMRRLIEQQTKPPFACPWLGCGSKFTKKCSLVRHSRDQHRSRMVQCTWPGCQLRTKSVYLNTHINRVHRKKKQRRAINNNRHFTIPTTTIATIATEVVVQPPSLLFECDWPGCQQRLETQEQLEQHQNQHRNEQPVACDVPGCGFRCCYLKQLREHKAIAHTSVGNDTSRQDNGQGSGQIYDKNQDVEMIPAKPVGKKVVKKASSGPLKCPVSGCLSQFKKRRGLREHAYRVHRMTLPMKCRWPGCDFETWPSHMKAHYNGHRALVAPTQPASRVRCTWSGCGKELANADSLRRHQRKQHLFKCIKCSYPDCKYRTQAVYMKSHVRRVHRNEPIASSNNNSERVAVAIKDKTGSGKEVGGLTGDGPALVSSKCGKCGQQFNLRTIPSEHRCVAHSLMIPIISLTPIKLET